MAETTLYMGLVAGSSPAVSTMKFELDEGEQARYDAWYKQHLEKHHADEEPYCGAIGGRISYVITPTGLGEMLTVQCGICVQENLKKRVVEAVLGRSPDHDKDDPASPRYLLTDFSDW